MSSYPLRIIPFEYGHFCRKGPQVSTSGFQPMEKFGTVPANQQEFFSIKLQLEIAKKRGLGNVVAKYEPGDLVLWNPREKPSDFLATKLSPRYKGPYEVLQQRKKMLNVVTSI